jgi:hypothetical protein
MPSGALPIKKKLRIKRFLVALRSLKWDTEQFMQEQRRHRWDDMEDTLTSVYLTHLLLKLQIAELDYREALEFSFNYTNALRVCERLGDDLFGSWSTVCRNGKALILYFRQSDEAPRAVRYIKELSRRHLLTVVMLEDETGLETELDVMSIEHVEVPPPLCSESDSEQDYSLAGLWKSS